MRKVLARRNILFGFLLVAFIIVFEIILARLKLPAWPAFMVMVSFFMAHEDPGTAPRILIGGLAGIACIVLLGEFDQAFDTYLGAETSKLIFVGIFVYSIVLLKDVIPYVFNTYAFLFFLAASIASRAPNPEPYVWMGVELAVGGIFIVGVIGINRIVDTVLEQRDAVSAVRSQSD
ncbi:MAG: hypothetical protein BWZ01_02872 [Deltaproteobacteria bacterium ADurb.BinA179]|nr:MAG: hypothetical protein BWZ01_02872 [Deltaproteobacteria bacterium ADurb.BinA179]HNR51877.1 hypothetical protein [Deltaproteobacteria bacterium]HRR21775.1 hypothetical protein [Desulfomonilia bacterium]HNU74035.1 hypothetical protein [Deltaproteobacteria bacterium]HOD70503.1 hypothetical protein [Deltaproteobacteria bacterium]